MKINVEFQFFIKIDFTALNSQDIVQVVLQTRLGGVSNSLIRDKSLGLSLGLPNSHCDSHKQSCQGESLGYYTCPHHVLGHLPVTRSEAPQAVGQSAQSGQTS